MLKSATIASLVFAIMLAGTANAASNSIVTLLQNYSVPTSLINSLSQVNITYNGTNYAALYGSGGALNFVVNIKAGTFVLSQNTIFSIIRNYTVQNSYGKSNLSAVAASMHSYMATASAPLADCVAESGLANPGASCTEANFCQACKTVSYCNKVLNEVGGPQSPVGYGFVNFDSNYTHLNANLSSFFNAINSVTPGNINTSFSLINSSFQNISRITQKIWQNPIFPATGNTTADQVSKCVGFGASTSNTALSGAPWYCNSVEFCPYLTVRDSLNQPTYRGDGFNYTVLNEISAMISTSAALPFSNSQIESIAANANTTTSQYIAPQVTKQRSSALNTILDTSLSGYNTTVYASNVLLTHINNASFASALAALKSNYSILTTQYLSINITRQAVIVANQLSSLSSSYKRTNASYSALVAESQNNTGTIVVLQLDGNSGNAALSSLAFRELRINAGLSGKVSNTISVKVQLDSVKSGLSTIGSGENPAVSLSRSLGGSAARSINPSISLPYIAAVAISPFTASIPAIIIGIVGLVAVLIIYILSNRKKQATIGSQKQKHWLGRKTLALIAIVLVLYMVISVALSFGDNGSAPISAFNSALSSSQDVVVALNGTQTNGMLSCYSQIQTKLKGLGKSILNVQMSGGKCTVSNTTLTTDECMNSYAARNIPVIMLTNSSSSGITAYSFYGTVLQESGNSSTLAKCTAAQVIG